jgi:hypothetical protein
MCLGLRSIRGIGWEEGEEKGPDRSAIQSCVSVGRRGESVG